MVVSVIEKVLSLLLAVAILACAGSLWYADHQRGLMQPLKDQVANAAIAVQQANAARDAAQKAAQDAEMQAKGAEFAQAYAAAQVASAVAANKQAHLNIDKLGSNEPTIANVLNTTVPDELLNAIYFDGDKK